MAEYSRAPKNPRLTVLTVENLLSLGRSCFFFRFFSYLLQRKGEPTNPCVFKKIVFFYNAPTLYRTNAVIRKSNEDATKDFVLEFEKISHAQEIIAISEKQEFYLTGSKLFESKIPTRIHGWRTEEIPFRSKSKQRHISLCAAQSDRCARNF